MKICYFYRNLFEFCWRPSLERCFCGWHSISLSEATFCKRWLLAPSFCNACLLTEVYSLWYDRLVLCLLWWPKTTIFKIVLATLKSENMVFGNKSLYDAYSCVSKFVWRLLYNIQVKWLDGDLKLTKFKMLWSP